MAENIPCKIVGWKEIDELVSRLVRQMREAAFSPDLIVAIARGGFVPARLLADRLDVFDMDSMKIEHYRGVRKGPRARLRYPLAAEVAGRRVLVVDDVSDSGETFELALAHIRERGTPAALRTAAMHHKESSSYRPDFHAGRLQSWSWLVYPWAMSEDLRSLLEGVEPFPADPAKAARLLEKRHGARFPLERLEEILTYPASRG